MVPVFLSNEPVQLSAFDDARNILSFLYIPKKMFLISTCLPFVHGRLRKLRRFSCSSLLLEPLALTGIQTKLEFIPQRQTVQLYPPFCYIAS